MIEQIEGHLPQWLVSQRWYSNKQQAPSSAKIVQHDVMRDAWPKLIWTLVQTDDGALYQVPIGLREVEHIGGVLLGHEHALIGEIEIDGRAVLAYDALIDSVLGRVLFDVVTDGQQQVRSMRPIGAEQSNTSLVFDNRLIIKFFRRLYEGANPDLEVTKALSEGGFEHVPPVVATWERGNHDLAVCQPFLVDGTEGWKLALASVRDFLGMDTTGGSSSPGSPSVRIESNSPASAGGDFGAESRRLGEMTGELHIALEDSFGSTPFDPTELIASLESGLDVVEEKQRPALQKVIDALRSVDAAGLGGSTRVHGDYHLGQTLRSVSGWYVLDFEGEPVRPLDERTRPTSPLKDVAGMVRSFQYAAATGVREHMPSDAATMAVLADAWEVRNRDSFRNGYLSVSGVDRFLPSDPEIRRVLMTAFEVEKAIYELEYERSYRPDWIGIPLAALERLLPA